jgi:hypothetical protein
MAGRPVFEAVGRVVEHLPHDLSTNPQVRRLLDLHEHRNSLAVDERMIERPDLRASLRPGYAHLASDEREPGPVSGSRRHTGDHLRMVLERPLEDRLARVGLLVEHPQRAGRLEEDRLAVHVPVLRIGRSGETAPMARSISDSPFAGCPTASLHDELDGSVVAGPSWALGIRIRLRRMSRVASTV